MYKCISCGARLEDDSEDDLCFDCLMEESNYLLEDDTSEELDFSEKYHDCADELEED